MIAHTTGDITAGSPLVAPLVEHNAEHQSRPVILKIRKVGGKTGWLLRRIGWVFGAPEEPEALGHHAMSVGVYNYEMTREKTMIGQRLTQDEAWKPTVGEVFCGYTNLSDNEIQKTSVSVENWMKSRNGGNYHIKKNNCQHFVHELLRQVVTASVDVSESETSSMKSSSTVSASTKAMQTADRLVVQTTDHVAPKVQLRAPEKPHLAMTTISVPTSARC